MRRIFGALVLVACGAASSESTAPAASSTSAAKPCWPVAVMRLSVLEHGSEWEPVAEMQGDGSIYNVTKGRPRFVGRVKDDALLDKHDVPSLVCVHDEVSSPAAPNMTPARYGQHDELVDKRLQITVADDGTVDVVTGHGAAGAPRVRVEGPIARARRTATLLVLTALGGPPD